MSQAHDTSFRDAIRDQMPVLDLETADAFRRQRYFPTRAWNASIWKERLEATIKYAKELQESAERGLLRIETHKDALY